MYDFFSIFKSVLTISGSTCKFTRILKLNEIFDAKFTIVGAFGRSFIEFFSLFLISGKIRQPNNHREITVEI